jgi:hypothetical protein
MPRKRRSPKFACTEVSEVCARHLQVTQLMRASALPQGNGRTTASNPLIGTWRLVSWENRSVEDGEVSYPLGKDASGYIMYNQDGYMFVANPMCRFNR